MNEQNNVVVNNNNQLIAIINNTTKKYNLTNEEYTELVNRYKNNPKDPNVLAQEIETIGNFYSYQHKLKTMELNTPNLETGKNYYLTAFDKNSNIYLQPVTVSITNPETSEVLVENTFKGYQKHTTVDDLEIAICQIGRLLNFDIVEEYRLYNGNKQKDSIIIRDLINENEFYDVENLRKRFNKLIVSGKIRKEKWVETSETLSVANTKDDYKLIIDYGLNILKSLPSILEEDYNRIESKYFDMLLFDSIIGQSERNFKDYGIICDKVTKRYTYAPLFDNVFPSILKNNDVISVNGITCNRYELIECLFYNYYDKIQNRVQDLILNKDKYINNIDIILKYNVDLNNYMMFKNNILTNLNYFDRLEKERNLPRTSNSAGYVNAVQMLIGLGIIIAFSICIAYLLYCIK